MFSMLRRKNYKSHGPYLYEMLWNKLQFNRWYRNARNSSQKWRIYAMQIMLEKEKIPRWPSCSFNCWVPWLDARRFYNTPKLGRKNLSWVQELCKRCIRSFWYSSRVHFLQWATRKRNRSFRVIQIIPKLTLEDLRLLRRSLVALHRAGTDEIRF